MMEFLIGWIVGVAFGVAGYMVVKKFVHINAILLMIVCLTAMTACTSVIELGGGHYGVPSTAAVRDPFGTNVVFAKLKHCSVRVATGIGYEYKQCRWMSKAEMEEFYLASSQGQGGQVAAGALTAVGFGVLGATMPGSSQLISQSVTQSVAVKGHR